ncbi:methyltransferase domain-containing protein [Catellatospora sichuanensis]|uniref:methyltransferase domain-containing protein n=1 Tax=Catellatospora sichuanensis TaxID=1969805 RepID=UPI001182C55C|nr:methyltransferase domain-containing protein [Catellatospora sichuanensis]
MTNTWMGPDSSKLLEAYDRHNKGVLGQLRQRLLTRGLSLHMPTTPQRVVDVGGGEGYQAINLARQGHDVVLLDPDPKMLAAAEQRLQAEAESVRSRVELVLGFGEQGVDLLGEGRFDLVCCHGILMYVDDPVALLNSVVALARPAGLLSVLGLNREASAMRPGLAGRWTDAIGALATGLDAGGNNLDNRPDKRSDVELLLTAADAAVLDWYGIRVFSDNLGDTPPGLDFEELAELEWLVGAQDPYRSIARLFHIVARRGSVVGGQHAKVPWTGCAAQG